MPPCGTILSDETVMTSSVSGTPPVRNKRLDSLTVADGLPQKGRRNSMLVTEERGKLFKTLYGDEPASPQDRAVRRCDGLFV